MAWPIIGHEWAVALLSQSLAADRLAHAYLFSGPPQVGKTTLALALAQALNCEQSDPPCGRCTSCRRIAEHTHPDVRVIVGEGVAGSIKIEQVRALRREAVLAPYESRYRVFILRRMDRASMEAANSLLKILEEPPAHVVLGLTTLSMDALPATIVSRCQRLELRATSCQRVEAALCEGGMPQPSAQLLARLSGGRVGWAFSARQDDVGLQQRQEDLERLLDLLAADRVGRFEFASNVSQQPATVRRLIELWLSWWRDLLLVCGHAERDVSHVDRLNDLRSLAKLVTLPQALAGLKALQTATAQLEANVNPRLALEVLLLELPHWRRLGPNGLSEQR